LSAREIPRLGCEAECGRVAPAGLILTEIASDAISQAESSLSDSTGPRRQRDSTRSYSFGCGRGARHTLDRFRRQSTSGPPAPHLVHAATVLREVLERKHPEQRWIVEVEPRDEPRAAREPATPHRAAL
jgi:hypothetical protein